MSYPGDPATRTRLPEDEYRPRPPRRRRPLVNLFAVLVVIVLLIVAVAIAHSGGGKPSAAATGSGPSAQSSAGGSPPAVSTALPPSGASVDGVAVGYTDTESGARSAATNYAVALGSDALMSASVRHSVVAAIADPATLSVLQSQLDTAFAAQQQQWGLDSSGRAPSGLTFVSRLTAMGVATDAYTPQRATIDVWTVGLTGLSGTATDKPVAETWNTEHVSLHWIDGDWKWVSATTTAGPVPISGVQAASPLSDVAGAVGRFGGFRYGS